MSKQTKIQTRVRKRGIKGEGKVVAAVHNYGLVFLEVYLRLNVLRCHDKHFGTVKGGG